MAVPDFQAIMLPLLHLAQDGKEHTLRRAIDALGDQLHLSDADKEELLPSGRQSRFDNRVGWSMTHLKKAGLVENTGRGRFHITQRGLDLLATNPPAVNMRLLMQFPEFVEFRSRQSTRQNGDAVISGLEGTETAEIRQTPDEILAGSYQTLRQTLAQELLDRVKHSSPRFFERLVVDLLVSMGYGGSRKDAGQAIGRSGDGGIDGIIKEDRLGLDVVYVQAKRWETTVGRPDLQAFAGSLDGVRAKKGVFITTSQFAQTAQDYVGIIDKKIVLIDGEQLAQWMIDFNVGVTTVETYTVKKIDFDYFGEE